MRVTVRRLKRSRVLPLLTCLTLALLILHQLGTQPSRTRSYIINHENGRAKGSVTTAYSPDTPVAIMPQAAVPRGQAFFYTYPESNRLGSFETWRPKELVARARLGNKQHIDDNIFVVVQSSPRTLWRYVPTLLMSVLQDFSHFEIYSYAADAIKGTEIIDALALLDTDFVARSPHLEPYRVMRIVRDSHVNVPLDDVPIAGAQSLARFVTLPMLQHAYTQHSEHDWYVIILDSTYLFNQNLRDILAGLDPNKPVFLGSAVQGPKHVFADIGSGIVLSKAALRLAFAIDSSEINRFNDHAAAESRGDYVLAMYLKERVGLELDVKLSQGQFQGNPLNKVSVSARNWCTRIVSVNPQHPRELDMLAEYSYLKRQRPVVYSDIYFDFIKPYLHSDTQQNWDNMARDIEFSVKHNGETQAHKSLANCREACTHYPQCLMLRYDMYRQYCGLGLSTISLGQPIIRYDTKPDQEICDKHGVQCQERGADEPTASEWLIDRMRAMRQTIDCDPLSADINNEGTEYGTLDQVEGWWHRARRFAQDSDPLKNYQKA